MGFPKSTTLDSGGGLLGNGGGIGSEAPIYEEYSG